MDTEIPKAAEWKQKVFSIANEKHCQAIALEVFKFQFKYNQVYRNFCEASTRNVHRITDWKKIPFLPISFFKSHHVQTTNFDPFLVFESSGTTGSVNSRHYIKDAGFYEESFHKSFQQFQGDIKDYCILGLLPSYLERGQSSLVYMVDQLIKESGHRLSGFYLHDHKALDQTLKTLEASKQKTLLFGVTYALLDFASNFPQKLRHITVMDTGGMKGRGREMIRYELDDFLKKGFGVEEIHSEYGMTELLSQAYAVGGKYKTPGWMKILVRDETDPFQVFSDEANSRTGLINVIDLANIYSCSFIATDDIGKLHPDGSFEVLGRMDGSDVRGCSLMVV